jgi:hypothetical protein
MSKYNQLKYLKKTKARTVHQCAKCEEIISVGEYYYKEALTDEFLQFLHGRSFCINCYEKFGETLLMNKTKRKHYLNKKSKRLNNFL